MKNFAGNIAGRELEIYMAKEKICPFNIVKVNIPRKLIIKCFYHQGYIDSKKTLKISRKLREIEGAIIRLEHVRSIVGRIKLKCQS